MSGRCGNFRSRRIPDHTDYREIVEPFFRRARDPEMIAQVEALLEKWSGDALTKDSIEVVRHFCAPGAIPPLRIS